MRHGAMRHAPYMSDTHAIIINCYEKPASVQIRPEDKNTALVSSKNLRNR